MTQLRNLLNGIGGSTDERRWREKKMKMFIKVTSSEVLVELEQTLRRIQGNPDMDKAKLLGFQQIDIW